MELLQTLDDKNIRNAVLVADNVSFHRKRRVKNLIQARGHIMIFLAHYSPFLDLIEEVFRKWKRASARAAAADPASLLVAIETTATQI